MASISPQTALIVLWMLDMQHTYIHILRLEIERQNALLLYLVNTYANALTPADCAAIGDTLAAGNDAIRLTAAA